MNQPQPSTTDLAKIRTKLALERTRQASERTLMAWIRTSLSMISFGFSIDTFFRALTRLEGFNKTDRLVEPTILGLVLVGLGTIVLFLGALQHFLYMRQVGTDLHFLGEKATWTYMLSVAVFVIIAGSMIFAYMLVQQ